MRATVFIGLLVLCVLQTAVWAAMEPVLTVTEARRGQWTFTGLTTPEVSLDDESGCDAVSWVFTWDATPGAPGRTITDFRYGFDIVDLNDPYAWDIDWTPTYSATPRTFYTGTHTFHVEVRDDTGEITRGSFVINMTELGWVPALTITEFDRGEWLFVGMQSPAAHLTDTPTVPATPWSFEWYGTACHMTTAIDAYRYGWDIQDPGDDSQWSDWGNYTVAPPRVFTAGTHTFLVETRDTNGSTARGTIVFEIQPLPVPVKPATWGKIKALYSE
jgi:hypothetical protein